MYGFGHLWELVVVLLIALIFLGPKRLPELGSSLGRTIREFRKSTSEVQDQLTGETTAAPHAATSVPRDAEQYDMAGSGAPHAAASRPQDKEVPRT